MSTFGCYEYYASVEGGWLGDLPKHWTAEKLKHLADAFASNVDKKSKEGESPVRLCNYTDVYYNECVTAELDYMKATATPDQIAKFTLRGGDTIITKDSEGPDDIAIPTFVPKDLPGVICGYHLAVVRPSPRMDPRFLNLTFKCGFARAYFATRANGLTRYGLGSQALGAVVFPVPPLEEQTQIARFLDYETAKIDRLIEKQEQLIALLQEKRQAVISHAVTKGLDPSAPLRDFGVEWLGQVPAHWTVKRLRHLFLEPPKNGISPQPAEFGGVATFSIAAVRDGNVDIRGNLKSAQIHPRDAAPFWVHPGDVMMMRGNGSRSLVGSAGIVEDVPDGGCIYPDILIRIRFSKEVAAQFSVLFLNSPVSRPQVEWGAKTAAGIWKVSGATVAEFLMPVPPRAEQEAILAYLAEELRTLSALTDASEAQKALLAERRTALISAAVTGKIDVRGWKPPEGSEDRSASERAEEVA